jgi:hypothetical protein
MNEAMFACVAPVLVNVRSFNKKLVALETHMPNSADEVVAEEEL